jgi:multiple sugar transport system permease protein
MGMVVALMLNNLLGFKRILRASMLLPWIVPTVLSTLAWKWMLDPTFSIVNWLLFQLGLIRFRVDWLGGPVMALWSVILVNVWRGTPFFAITLLAGLQTISPEVYEAASIDGANAWQRFWTVTWPLLMPVTMVVMLFSVIQTFADFQLVYILTGGGPANSTHLFATYAYQIGIQIGKLGEGAAASLAMFPVLFMVVLFQLWYIRRGEGGVKKRGA